MEGSERQPVNFYLCSFTGYRLQVTGALLNEGYILHSYIFTNITKLPNCCKL